MVVVVLGWRKEGEVGVRRRFEKTKLGPGCVRVCVCVGEAVFSFSCCFCVCVIFSAFVGTSYIYVGRT